MIQIAIADDDAFLAKIEKYVRKYQEENNTDIQLTTFSDAKELIEGYHPVYDIVILDIEMPEWKPQRRFVRQMKMLS